MMTSELKTSCTILTTDTLPTGCEDLWFSYGNSAENYLAPGILYTILQDAMKNCRHPGADNKNHTSLHTVLLSLSSADMMKPTT